MLLRLSETSAATKCRPTVMEHQASKVGAGLNTTGALLYHASVPAPAPPPQSHSPQWHVRRHPRAWTLAASYQTEGGVWGTRRFEGIEQGCRWQVTIMIWPAR
jgi:hypothetical protein